MDIGEPVRRYTVVPQVVPDPAAVPAEPPAREPRPEPERAQAEEPEKVPA